MVENFKMATLDNLVEAFSALHIIMCAQFYDISIITPSDLNNPSLMGDFPSFEDKPYISTITGNFLIKIPRDKDWKDNDKYSFDWNNIKNEVEPCNKYPYKPPIKKKKLL